MVRLIIICIVSLLSACSQHAVKTQLVQFDYIAPEKYELNKHQYIHVSFKDPALSLPEASLKFEALKLIYTQSISKADVVVYIHFSPSYLVHRAPISRQVITYDQDDKGEVNYVVVNRGFIRTPYTIEVVDMIADKLIFQTQGAGNYSIDASPKGNLEKTENQLTQEFYLHRKKAREQLLSKTWENLKQLYLRDITVHFSQLEFHLVSKHTDEVAFEKAYELLKKNDKNAAKQALNIYNNALKRYEAKPTSERSDEENALIQYLNQGITASTKIVNLPNSQRF